MTYTTQNFKTKKALKEALATGQKLTCYEPGLGAVPRDGRVFLEGPHYPLPHRWYAEGQMKDGFLVSVR